MKQAVFLVDEMNEDGDLIQETLEAQGHQVVTRVRPQQDLVSQLELAPHMKLLIACVRLVDNILLQQLTSINHVSPLPVILFAEQSRPGLAAEVTRSGVSSYIVDGLEATRIETIIDVALARFAQTQTLRKELDETRQALQERKTIDRAKGLIMKHRRCTEDEAYGALRKEAMNRNQRIAAVAERVIHTAQLFG